MAKKIKLLETFENQYPDRDYNIVHTAPDFGTIIIEYIPDKLCIELKSLKLYLQSFRNEGVFYETVTNKILDDLVKVCEPRYMLVTAEFTTRGGISSIIEVEYVNDNYLED